MASAQPGEGAYCTRQAFDAFLNSLKRVEGRLSLVVTPTQKTYKVGEPIRITVTSPVAGDLLLMSIDSKGVVFPIFPNPHQAEGAGAAIAANSALTLPQPEQGYAFETQGPLGPSRLIAIVRPPGVQIPLPCARPLTKGVAISIGDGQGVADPEPPLPKFLEGWGYANFSYEVTAAK